MNETALSPLLERLAQAGIGDADLEIQDGVLILKLDPAGRSRLLADLPLRRDLLEQARGLGFGRLALELGKAA